MSDSVPVSDSVPMSDSVPKTDRPMTDGAPGLDTSDVAERRSAYARLFRLDGRRVLVVGAAGGIGREVALGLAAHGASVLCADKDDVGAAETARLIEAARLADPVNETAPIRRSVVRAWPTSAPPVTSCAATTGALAPWSASRTRARSHRVASGVGSAGFTTTGHPAASAGESLWLARSSG